MRCRLGLALVVSMVFATTAAAQVVRFETTVGDFDMVLNPTNNPVLQGHVDNMLEYVDDNRYEASWINRAAEGFVLQMGGFYSHTKRPPIDIASTRPIVPFVPVAGEPATEIDGLSNTVGTVSLALPGNGMGGTNQDAGTSSFFINLTDNGFLDADFTVFAAISDMTPINRIMSLMQIDYTAIPSFGAGAGNLGFSDVPLDENGFQVFIRRAFVINDPLAVARARAAVAPVMAASAAAAGSGGGAGLPITASAVVPEPASLALLSLSALFVLRLRMRRRG
jgi:cyclophilin family peptidyl-prolyl cis-trans isomerase